MRQPVELAASQLRRICDPDSLGCDTTESLPKPTEVLGQPRAVAALSFGASITSHGFNLFAISHTGSGKTTLNGEYLERQAASQPALADYCYVYNFSNPVVPCRYVCPRVAPLPSRRMSISRWTTEDGKR